jgi:hypothetical protein
LTPLKLDLRIVYQFLACQFVLDHATNIFVPPDQVINTVDLYFLLNRQRCLPLRPLFFVLGENIQMEPHDSTEDV